MEIHFFVSPPLFRTDFLDYLAKATEKPLTQIVSYPTQLHFRHEEQEEPTYVLHLTAKDYVEALTVGGFEGNPDVTESVQQIKKKMPELKESLNLIDDAEDNPPPRYS